MSRQRRPVKPSTPEQATAFVQRYAVGLVDRGDGHGADWPVVAQLLFRAAFAIVDKAGNDARMRSVLRRVEAGLYDRLAGNEADPLATPLPLSPIPAVWPERAPEGPDRDLAPRR